MKKLRVLLVVLFVIMSILLVGCKKNCKKDDNTGGGGGNNNLPNISEPTKNDWLNAGFNNEFKVDVNGTLATSIVVEDEIQMKWTGSDETSLDKTISWLQSNGYTTFNDVSAEKEAYGDIMVSYSAEKENAEGELVVTEAVYFKKDYEVLGQTFKAGDLYLAVTKSETNNPGNNANWPKAQIKNILGFDIPEYEGSALLYSVTPYSLGGYNGVNITIQGIDEAKLTEYVNGLPSKGYAVDTVYGGNIKENADGSKIVIEVQNYGYNQMASITAYVIKSGGSYQTWDSISSQLIAYQSGGLPKYDGGTSFDVVDTKETDAVIGSLKQTQESIISAYNLALQFGQDVSELQEAYDEAQKLLQELEKASVHIVTVYGTNEDELANYVNKILSSPTGSDNLFEGDTGVYVRTYQDGEEYELTVTISNIENNALTIHMSKIPTSIYESGSDNPPYDDRLTIDDLPQNFKIKYSETVYSTLLEDVTITKVNDDWLLENVSYGETFRTYYKKVDGGWLEYGYYVGEWTLMSEEAIESIEDSSIYTYLDFILTNDTLDFTKSGTVEVAGIKCDKYVYNSEYSNEEYCISEAGFTLYYKSSMSYSGMSFDEIREITLWDESVTTFDVELPS